MGVRQKKEKRQNKGKRQKEGENGKTAVVSYQEERPMLLDEQRGQTVGEGQFGALFVLPTTHEDVRESVEDTQSILRFHSPYNTPLEA